MKYAMMGAVLITLPALIALVYSMVTGNSYLMWAALASCGLNTLPFVVAGLLMRKADHTDLGH